MIWKMILSNLDSLAHGLDPLRVHEVVVERVHRVVHRDVALSVEKGGCDHGDGDDEEDSELIVKMMMMELMMMEKVMMEMATTPGEKEVSSVETIVGVED